MKNKKASEQRAIFCNLTQSFMRFALIDNKKAEAAPGLKGLCPGCAQLVIARCGRQRIHHWAHNSNKMCDSWWEPETEWHRSWKNNFPVQWQEVFIRDELTGDRHIADVRTAHELVIEFQHSTIDPQERDSREQFYKSMVWVVDSARSKKDYPRFLKEKKGFVTIKKGLFRVDIAGECLPGNWIKSSVPVIFDFKGIETILDIEDPRNNLYCLFPGRIGRYGVLAEISRKAFINTVISGEWLSRAHNFMNDLNQVEQEWEEQRAREQKRQTNMIFEKFSGVKQYRRNRRF